MSLKTGLLLVAQVLGFFRFARWATARRVRILCYHGTWRAPIEYRGDAMFIRPETFRDRLRLLRARGYEVVDLDAVLTSRESLPPCPVVITIDDGWHGVFADMLPVLCEARCPATLYVDTAHLLGGETIGRVMAHQLARAVPKASWPPEAHEAFAVADDMLRSPKERADAARALARILGLDVDAIEAAGAFRYMTPDELRVFARTSGMRVELHTHNHELADHEPSRIRREIALNREALAELLGRDPMSFRHFCYPSGLMSDHDVPVLRSLGIRSATNTVRALVEPNAEPLRMPRLLDGDQATPIEFEAELSGFLPLARQALAWLKGLRPSPIEAPAWTPLPDNGTPPRHDFAAQVAENPARWVA